MNEPPSRPLRIGVNALYLIPGRVGGTEIYLRSLLQALAEIDKTHRYFVFMNRETGSELVPPEENWVAAPLGRASMKYLRPVVVDRRIS